MKQIPQIPQTHRQMFGMFTLAGAALLCLMAAPSASRAQVTGAPPRPATSSSATASDDLRAITYLFYAAANRADLVTYLEYDFLTTEGLRHLWPVETATGKPAAALNSFYGITRADYDRALTERKPRAEALLASGAVTDQPPQQVRLVQTAKPDFSAWTTADRAGVSGYAARGVRHETFRLVELLEGPQKGQHVWTTARLSSAAEPERIGWAATMTGSTPTPSAPSDTAAAPSGVTGVLRAENVVTVYDAVKRINILSGSVTNTTDQALENVEVEIVFVNLGGAPVARDRAISTTRLDPGQVWTFSVPWPNLAAGVSNGRAVSVKATPAFGGNTTAPATPSRYR